MNSGSTPPVRPVVQINDRGLELWRRRIRTLPDSTIADAPPGVGCGETVAIRLPDGTVSGTGYFNVHSRLPLRILAFDNRPIDSEYWYSLIENALRYRRRFYSDGESYRWIFGEADEIPGLIVDVFGNVVVVQVTTAGLEKYLELILDCVEAIVKPVAVVLACDSLPRRKEQLPLYRTVARGVLPGPFFTDIDGVAHLIDPVNGHKTGFFLDHRDNRERAAGMCAGKTVLDMFSYSAAFGIRAALSGAAAVTSVDVFEPAVEWGRKTALYHQCSDRLHVLKAEAFDFLKNTDQSYDLIFLDPPSFVRGSRRARRNLSNYIKINRFALDALTENGILVTSCCSFHVTPDDFSEIITSALYQSGRSARVFHIGSQSPDHPILTDVPGTAYLKCVFLESGNH